MVDVNQALDEAQIVAGKSHMYDLAELARAAHPDATAVVLSESDQGDWLGVDSIVRQEDDLARIEEEDDYFEDDGHASNLYTDVYVLRELYIQYDVRGDIEYSDRMGLRSFHMDIAKVLAELGPEPTAGPWPTTPEEHRAYHHWQAEVSVGDTILGFRDWVANQKEV